MKKLLSVILTVCLILSLTPVISLDAKAASVVSRVSRDDGTWLFPLSSSYWNSFTDWAGCTGGDTYCKLCHGNHSIDNWGDTNHTNQGGHNGIDIGAPSGTPVFSAASGKIYWGYDGIRGNFIIIEHICDGSYSYYSYYQHLSSIYSFSWGQEVSVGTTIGTVGNTGSSAGSHLHFGIVMAAKGSVSSSSDLSTAESYGWITTTGSRTGRILNNPSADSSFPTRDGWGGTSVIEPLKYHAGSVRYTFDKNQVTTGTSVSAPPKAPIIKSNGDYFMVGTTVSISWNSVSGATNYSYYLTEYPEGYAYTTNRKSGNITGTSVSFNDLKSGKYSIFVHANNSAGASGQSNWLSFRVAEQGYAPTKTSIYNGHIYTVYDYEMSWSFAKELCEKMGGHLVTVNDAAEQNFLAGLIASGKKDAYWLGADDFENGPWKWITGEPFTYTAWANGEPNGSGTKGEKEHFAEIRKSYSNLWNDVNNIHKIDKGFVLEVEPKSSDIVKTASYGGSTYTLVDCNATTWATAKAYCELLGGHLATVNSAEEYQQLSSLITQGEKAWYYLGGSKGNTAGSETWVDGSTFQKNWLSWSNYDYGNRLFFYRKLRTVGWMEDSYRTIDEINCIGFVCEKETPVCSHSWGSWCTETKATCTATGTETRTCSLCGETESRTVTALGHSYDNGTCTRCGTADPNYTAPVVTPTLKEVHFEKQTIYFPDQFTDVPSDQWFTPNVAAAVEFGLMKGSSATTFKPYGDVTIAEAITMAARIHSIYTTGRESFVQTDKWYQCYLDYAYENGIITTAYYNCDVNHKATRAQFAEIFAAALPEEALGQKNTIADNAIPDVKISAAYAPAVYKLYRAGILAGGDARGTFSPLTYITRAECATIVARMADSDNRVDFTLS